MRFIKYNMLFNEDWNVYSGARKYRESSEKYNTNRQLDMVIHL